MIISHRYQFIFLHCRKAAGSSVCVSLARFLGPADLQISALPETLQEGISPTARVWYEAARQSGQLLSLARLAGRRPHGRALAQAIDHAYRPLLGRKPPHAPAVRVAAAFPREWASFYKFAIVRNPWDKTVSDYFWRVQRLRRPPSFATYVEALMAGHSLNGVVPLAFHDNWPMYTVNDRVVADEIVRFESLNDALPDVFQHLQLAWDGWLPRSKAGHRPVRCSNGDRRQAYRSFYTPELESQVGRLYQQEIDQFGYRF